LTVTAADVSALRARAGRTRALVPVTLVAAGVGQQIAYPLVSGTARDALTVGVVGTLAAASVAQVAATRGGRAAVTVLLVTAGPGLAVEVLGVHTGVPFGHYAYTGALGVRVAGVPLIIGLAWTMLAWPAAVAARLLTGSVVARVVIGAWALAGADLFLDPQLVGHGYWRWADPSPHLPGVPEVPLTNALGWLAVALVLQTLLVLTDRTLPTNGAPLGRRPAWLDLLPAVLFGWLYVGWIVALAVFGHQAAAAGWGALALAPVVVPMAVRVARR